MSPPRERPEPALEGPRVPGAFAPPAPATALEPARGAALRASVPAATYRLQLAKGFGFREARALVPYLERLGVGCVYTSPILRACAGSPHGYDVADPRALSPELGTEDDLAALSDAARSRGLGLLVDIVPNHMAASHENPLWLAALEDGELSPHARFFDIDWHRGEGPPGQVVLPTLGEPYASALEGGRLRVVLEGATLRVAYWDKRFPLDPKTLGLALGLGDEASVRAQTARTRARLERLRGAIERLPGRHERGAGAAERRRGAKAEIARLLEELATTDDGRAFVEGALARLAGRPGDPSSFDRLDTLLRSQNYRLSFWRSARAEINYRRFFDISDLVGVRVEDPHVLEATHALVLRLVREGKITGLRIDHVDGLRDPRAYLERLRARAGAATYIVVEKILTGSERLPQDWPADGTTGYEFLKMAGGIFADARGVRALDELYARFTGERGSFEELVAELKARVLRDLFPGELHVLSRELARLAADDRHACDVARDDLEAALGAVTACLPVYRTYVATRSVDPHDRGRIEQAVAEGRRRAPAVEPRAFDFVRRTLLLELAPPGSPRDLAARELVARWQQLTGPVMAKGLEDTALYVHTRLLSLNVIGGRRSRARSLAELHAFNAGRARRGDLSLATTSTHDTKRSEDVQARIHVLSELADDWGERALRWSRWNEGKRRRVKGHVVPDPSEELLLYQTLLGAWPFDAALVPELRERVKRYLVKAAREAKVWSSWLSPDEEHERALLEFTDAILERGRGNRFLADFEELLPRVALHGALNALAQLVVKIGSPGVADVYQGSELWDLRLVDPDNRGPVDFRARARLLRELERRTASDRRGLLRELRASWRDGRIKLFATWQGLRFRRERRELFLAGEYLPLGALGDWRDHIVAFARRLEGRWALVVVPRLLARRFELVRFPQGEKLWGEAALALPPGAPRVWRNVFTDETVEAGAGNGGAGGAAGAGPARLRIARVFRRFPVAILEGIVEGPEV